MPIFQHFNQRTIQGSQGAQGAQGSQGSQGSQGTQGVQGPNPSSSALGIDGGSIFQSPGVGETTTSTTYTDLTTSGPSATVTVGSSGRVIVILTAGTTGLAAGANQTSYLSVAVSGATTVAASDSNSVYLTTSGNTNGNSIGGLIELTGLNAGSTTFTMKYRISAAQSTRFYARSITVIPL